MNVDVNMTDKAPLIEEMAPRIIQYQGQRACIRLEEIFWRVLEEEASARGTKFNELIHLYYNDPRAQKNKTAFLRKRAMEWQSARIHRAQERLTLRNTELRAVLRATIQPAIVFSDKQSVSRYNLPFRNWLAENIAPGTKEPDFETLRLSFRRSYAGILNLLEKGGGSAINEQATILIPGYVFSVRMNIVSVNRNAVNEQLFLGILNPG